MFEPIHRRTLSIPPASRDQFVHTHKDAISLSLTRCLDAAARKHKVGQNRFYGPCSSDRAGARSFPVEYRESRSFRRSVGLIADIRYRPSNTGASPRIVCSIVGIGVRSGLAAGGNRDSNSRSLRRRREGSRATRGPFRGAPHGFLHAPVRAVGFLAGSPCRPRCYRRIGRRERLEKILPPMSTLAATTPTRAASVS